MSLRPLAAPEARRSGSSRQGCVSYEVKVLCRQLPDRTASISGAWGGNNPREARMEKSRLPYGVGRIGRSDLGGEQTCGPEHERMTAASKSAPYGSRCTVQSGAPTQSERGEGRCLGGRNGYMHLKSRRGRGPSTQGRMRRTTSGRSFSQQGLTATCIDLVAEDTTEARGGWRTGA